MQHEIKLYFIGTTTGESTQYGASSSLSRQSGLSSYRLENRENYYFAELADGDDPLSTTRFGHTLKIGNTDWVNVAHNVKTNTKSITYLKSKTETKVKYNQYGQEIEAATFPSGLYPVKTDYDGSGKVISVMQGTSMANYTYDDHGRVIREIFDSTLTLSYSYDSQAEDPQTLTLPSGRVYRFGYNRSGQLLSITMPSGSVHRLSTVVATGKTTKRYDAPNQANSFAKDYNVDGDLVLTRYPSGNRAVKQIMDGGGRLSRLEYDDHIVDFQYRRNTGTLARMIHRNAGQSDFQTNDDADDESISFIPDILSGTVLVSYDFDGLFETQETMQIGTDEGQTMTATFSYEYNSKFQQTTTTLTTDTGQTASYTVQYDAASRPSSFSGFRINARSTGSITLIDSNMRYTTKHDGTGYIIERSLLFKGRNVFSLKLHYGSGSRILQKDVRFGSCSTSYNYKYDVDGQLTKVSANGVEFERYTYDLNGNRIEWTVAGTKHTATYNSRDQLTRVDSIPYEVDEDGFLFQRSMMKYQYSSRGELVSVIDSVSGRKIYSYLTDGLGRRVLRSDEYGSTTRYLYGDLANPHIVTHVLTDNEMVSLYYDQSGLLFAMDRGELRFYVATDHLGTPLALIDAKTGQISKHVRYTTYGVVLYDSNPHHSMQLGFAGGILDPGTELIHFLFRDYHPLAGRWTARDPSLYTSLQPNLYQYSFNDPINMIDPLGLFCIGGSFYNVFGGGAQFCVDSSGVSACLESGVGSGISTNLNVAGRPSRPGHKVSLFAEAWAGKKFGSLGAAGAATAEYELITPTDPCEDRFNWDVWGGGNVISPIGNAQARYSIHKGPSVHGVFRKGGFKENWGVKSQAKAGVRYCHGWEF